MKTYTVTIRSRYTDRRDIVFVTATREEQARVFVLNQFREFDILRVSAEDRPYKYMTGLDASRMDGREAALLQNAVARTSRIAAAWDRRGALSGAVS